MTVSISSEAEGFRRCGIAHAKGPVKYPAGHWSEEQLAVLRVEPMLTVVEIEDAPDLEAEKKAQAQKEAAEKKAAADKEAAEKDAAEKKATADKAAAAKKTPASGKKK